MEKIKCTTWGCMNMIPVRWSPLGTRLVECQNCGAKIRYIHSVGSYIIGFYETIFHIITWPFKIIIKIFNLFSNNTIKGKTENPLEKSVKVATSPNYISNFDNLFNELQANDSVKRAKAEQELLKNIDHIDKLISIYKNYIQSDPKEAVLAGRVIGRRFADSFDPHQTAASTTKAIYGLDIAFTPCVCGFCSKLNQSIPIPERGRYIAFYGQTDNKNCAYSLPVICDYCNKQFYIAWDSDPRI